MSRSQFRDRSRRANGRRSKRVGNGRSGRIANGRIVSDRLAANNASDRDNAVNARNRGANNPNRAGKILNKAASKLARDVNAQIGTVSKPSPAEKARGKAVNNPNRGGKVAASGAVAVAEVVAPSGTIKVKAIAGVVLVEVGSRIASADAIVNGKRNVMIARRRKCVSYHLSQHRLKNRRKSRRPLVCGTRYLGRLPNKRRRLLTHPLMSPVLRRICETSHARPAVAFPMRTPTIRCRCSTRRTKGIVLLSRRKLPMKMLARTIDREADRVDEVEGGVADVSWMIVHQKVERAVPRGSARMSRVSSVLSLSLKMNSPMTS
jgi:hypothetical protein